MNIIKILFLLLALLLLALGAMFLLSMTFTILKIAFWIVVIGAVIALLMKFFGGGSDPEKVLDKEQTRIEKTELTIEEYKRKIEAQLKGNDER